MIKGFLDGIRPEPRLLVSQWADMHRRLSAIASAEPGQWRTDRVPFIREPMDKLSAHDETEEVIICKSAQVAGTEMGNNWIGYIIDSAPQTTLMVQPTDSMVKRNSKLRIAPMIADNPRLREKLGSKSRDSGDTLTQKTFPGMMLILAGANSASGLRSAPAGNIFLDEVDAYPHDLDGEGSPIDLAKARSRTFSRKKILIVSTPTTKQTSVIWKAFLNSDQRYYHVPCPLCGAFQNLRFDNLRYEGDSPETFKPNTVRYECDQCAGMIDERHKLRMLKDGFWVAHNSALSSPKKAGYHINSLYSPFAGFPWPEIVKSYLNSKDDLAAMKTFTNTVLGLPTEETGDVPSWGNLYNKREDYELNRPNEEVVFITIGADVQKDRIEFEVVGWCEGKKSYSIDYRVLVGNVAETKVWDELAKVVSEVWVSTDGIEIPVRLMAVDSGAYTSHVYDFCRRFDATRVIPTKGSDSLNMAVSVPRQVDTARSGKKVGKTKVWMVGSSLIKSEIYGWLRLEKSEDGSTPNGYMHFPQYDQRYFRGITGEELRFTITNKNQRKYEWHKTYDRNEPLDCRVYARAAAAVVGIDRFKPSDWQTLRNSYNRTQKVEKPKKEKKKSSYW